MDIGLSLWEDSFKAYGQVSYFYLEIGGQQTVEQAYVSEVIDKDKNIHMIANIGASAVLGFTFGPVLGYVGLKSLNFKIGSFEINENTSAGIIQAIVGLVMICVTIFCFDVN
jgi:uncharacterized membrane protein